MDALGNHQIAWDGFYHLVEREPTLNIKLSVKEMKRVTAIVHMGHMPRLIPLQEHEDS